MHIHDSVTISGADCPFDITFGNSNSYEVNERGLNQLIRHFQKLKRMYRTQRMEG